SIGREVLGGCLAGWWHGVHPVEAFHAGPKGIVWVRDGLEQKQKKKKNRPFEYSKLYEKRR
ncbi:hypothetical protein J8J20_24860, partial [Mycobacterium tuberculosis]|nr:hypothetical protein [Mycobacterium tuberculosis]